MRQVVRVISGEHIGTIGNVVSIPWLGNLWNTRMTLNISDGNGRRTWIYVWRWQVEPANEHALERIASERSAKPD